MVNYIEGKKIVKVMHQNCITAKAYKEISSVNEAMDLILDSSIYNDIESNWIDAHEDLKDEYGELTQEALNKMGDECATLAWDKFISFKSFDCDDFTLYIIDEDADMYDITR